MSGFKVMSRAWVLVLAFMLAGCRNGADYSGLETSGKVSLRSIYGDNMVFQRGMPVRVCGNGDPGTKLSVEMNGKSVTVKVGDNGEWVADLPAMEAGGPYDLKVSGKECVSLKNVMVGEVWVCSGQSNMEWRVERSDNAVAEIAAANYPGIRLFQVKKATSPFVELNDCGGVWEACTPKTVGSFSAVGYFFGRKLHQELGVPVGLINSSWGGTLIEPWISLDGFKSSPVFSAYVERIETERTKPEEKEKEGKRETTGEILTKWKNGIDAHYHKEIAAASSWKDAETSDADWKEIELPGGFETVLGAIDGMVWFRRDFEVSADMVGKELELSLGRIDDCDETFINGVKVGETPVTVENHWQHERRYKVPAGVVNSGRNVIAVRVFDHYGDGGMFGPEVKMFLKHGTNVVMLGGKWRCKAEYAMDYNKVVRRPNIASTSAKQQFPTTLYNAMINPLVCLPVRGAIWYQGESNAGNPVFYRQLMELLINDWRVRWSNPDLVFLITQLSAFHRHTPKQPLPEDFFSKQEPPLQENWALLRESQFKAASGAGKAGIAVTIDIGDPIDIHPTNKQDVGLRLALAAEKIAYGKEVCHSGPVYRSMRVSGNRVRLEFDHLCGGLMVKGGKLKGFVISGEDKKFHRAEAVIAGDSIQVWSPEVKQPVAVRYAWEKYPEGCNLYNKAGLPAVPFRSDTW